MLASDTLGTRSIKGRFFEPHSARAMFGELMTCETGLVLHLNSSSPRAMPMPVSVSDRLGSLPRKLTFADGSLFEVAHDADLTGFGPRGAERRNWLWRYEGNSRAALFATLATIVVILVGYVWGVPLAARVAASLTPASVVEALDRETLRSADSALFSLSSYGPTTRVTAADFDALIQAAGLEQAGVRIVFRSAPAIGANAFALPGGTIVVTDQLLNVARNTDEIAGVLAHEIGHIEQRHPLQRLYIAAGMGIVMSALFGDASFITNVAIAQGAALQTLSFSRAFEAEADRRSVELMIAIKRDPTAFVGLIERIGASENKGGAGSIFSTHPGDADRRAAVTEYARSLGWSR